MLRLDLTLLTGRYVATDEGNRNEHEWPPHPARLFSALTATWADADEPDADERAALEWLECQGPPVVGADDVPTAHARTVVPHFVPVNDSSIGLLAETERRAAKLGDLQQALAAEQAADEPNPKKIAKHEAAIAKQLDVAAKVAVAPKAKPSQALELLPDGRPKQARAWPSVTPTVPLVSFEWPQAEPNVEQLDALDRLAERLVRLGHSTSLVAARFTDSPAPKDESSDGLAVWQPDPDGAETLRWVQPGQLAALERRFEQHQGSRPRTMPKMAIAYRAPEQGAVEAVAATSTMAGEWISFVVDRSHRRLPARRTVDVATAIRGALLHHAEDPPPPLLSGHAADGSPLAGRDHLAVVPLPFVGFNDRAAERANGLILGAALMLPADADTGERAALLAAAGRWRAATEGPGFELTLGRAGVATLAEAGDDDPQTVQPTPWSRASTVWATATPMALPRHPGKVDKGTAEARAKRWAAAAASAADACEHVGLPRPVNVDVRWTPFLAGADDARSFPTFARAHRGSGPARRPSFVVHARFEFDTPVAGPIVVGNGRYLGLGLLAPIGATR